MDTQIMVPGILVALKTSVSGGIEYQRNALEEDKEGRVKRWETTRIMQDPVERRAAGEAASRAAGLVAKLCVRTSFGLLCRNDREGELDQAVIEMRRQVARWNFGARHSFVYVSAIKGRIADNDEEAMRAIIEEAKELLDRMEQGLTEVDVKLIRDAASRARRLTEMMTEETDAQVTAAITAARQAARAIVRRGDDLADKVAQGLIEAEREVFEKARFSFLETAAGVIDSLPSVDLQRGASLEA